MLLLFKIQKQFSSYLAFLPHKTITKSNLIYVF